MKVVKKQVKTIYDIEISFKDFSKIYAEAKDDFYCEGYKAFKSSNLDDTTIGNIRKEFKNLKDANTIKYIVYKLGFDRVENYGLYKEKFDGTGVYSMVVSNDGDELN